MCLIAVVHIQKVHICIEQIPTIDYRIASEHVSDGIIFQPDRDAESIGFEVHVRDILEGE